MISPMYVANNMINRANAQDVTLTNLKLQKLMYILYAKFLHETGYSLFSDRFEAWKYGPVLTKVYDVFKIEGANPIVNLRPDNNGQIMIASETGDFGKCFDFVWGNYARKTARELVEITHGTNDVGNYETAWRITVTERGLGGFIKDEEIKNDGIKWFGAT